MSRQVTVAWDTTTQSFPAGTAVGLFNVAITGGKLAAPLSMDVAASPAVFAVDEEAEGDPNYTATVQLKDSTGNALGAAVSATFSVLAPPAVQIDVPNAVTVTVS